MLEEETTEYSWPVVGVSRLIWIARDNRSDELYNLFSASKPL
jgi:hypothetical protein